MRIKVNNFRCHRSSEFRFEDNKLNLLQGDSGIGKSTIFQAITWCLYGQVRNVSNSVNPQAKVWVELEFAQTSIFRQKGPNYLRYTTSTTTFEGETAQQEINKAFVSPELWSCICMLGQGEYNPLITSSAATRMSLLNSLAFGDDDPRNYHDRIRNEMRDLEAQIPPSTRRFQELLDQYQNFISQYQTQMLEPLNPLQEATLEEQLIQYKQEIETLSRLELEATALSSSRSTLEASVSRLQQELSGLPVHSEEDLQNRRRQLLRMKERDLLMRQLRDLNKQQPPEPQVKDRDFNLQQLSEIHHQEQLYNKELIKASKLKLEYNKEVIRAAISEVEGQIRDQKVLEEYQHLDNLKSHQQDLKLKLKPEVSLSTVEEARRRLHQHDMSLNSQPCPSCGVQLRLIGGKLTTTCPPPDSSREKILHQIVEAEKQLELQRQVLELDNLISQYNLPPLPSGPKLDIQQLKVRRDALFQIQYHDKPQISAEEVRTIIAWKEHQLQLQKLQVQLQNYADVQDQDWQQLEQDSKNHNHRVSLQRQLLELQARLKNIRVPEQSPEQLASKKQQLQHQIHQIQLQLQGSQLSRTAISLYQQLDNSRVQLEQQHKKYTGLTKLQELAHKLECQTLMGIIEQINLFFKQWCPLIFGGDISISLSLFRPLKSKSGEKQQLNFTICHNQGYELDFSECSGGEKERINLLLTLALQHQRGAGILLLDETLACLDTVNRDACLELLRSTCPGTVIVINHEVCEASFDVVLQVGADTSAPLALQNHTR